MKYFQYFYNTIIRNTWDAYLAELVINPDSREAGLDDIAFKYLGITLDKSTRKSFFNQKETTFSQKQIEYAAQDVEVLFGIMAAQEVQIKEHQLEKVADIEFQLGAVVADMEITGTPINRELWVSKIRHFEELHEESRLKMHEILFDSGKMDEQIGMFTRDSINLNSWQQIQKAFKNLGIDVKSTGERVISLVKHPLAKELLNYRGYEKILTSYGSSFVDKIHPFTGRLHADFNQMGTGTGRFSCREPNMQQIPEEFHECIQAEGYMLCTADYSQIELRILAQLSDDPNLLNAFTSGADLHKSTASLMFGIPMDSVTKEQRFIGKTLNFGISYGMGLGKLKDMLNAEANKNGTKTLGFPQIKDLQNRYYRSYRKAVEWLNEAGMLAYRQGYSETMLGRKRFYNRPNLNEMDQETFDKRVASLRRQGSNGPIQGTNADITKLAMINVNDEIKDAGYKANIILQVHDELVVLARKDQAQEVKVMLEEVMRKTAAEIITKVPVKADANVSMKWSK